MSDVKDFSAIVLHELKRQDEKLDKLVFKQMEQNETLVRNTVTLEEHVRRTNLLENRAERIEKDVIEVQDHVRNIKTILNILKPTKEKMKWLAVLAGLATGGHFGMKEITKIDHEQKKLEIKQEKVIENTVPKSKRKKLQEEIEQEIEKKLKVKPQK